MSGYSGLALRYVLSNEGDSLNGPVASHIKLAASPECRLWIRSFRTVILETPNVHWRKR